jgi:hypothetical protein
MRSRSFGELPGFVELEADGVAVVAVQERRSPRRAPGAPEQVADGYGAVRPTRYFAPVLNSKS